MDWKWSVGAEGHAVPTGWAIDGANRHNVRMLETTLEAVAERGLLADIDHQATTVGSAPLSNAVRYLESRESQSASLRRAAFGVVALRSYSERFAS